MEDARIIIETIGEAAEDMDAEAEAINEEATVDVAIIIMATIVTEMIITIPARYLPRVVKKI